MSGHVFIHNVLSFVAGRLLGTVTAQECASSFANAG